MPLQVRQGLTLIAVGPCEQYLSTVRGLLTGGQTSPVERSKCRRDLLADDVGVFYHKQRQAEEGEKSAKRESGENLLDISPGGGGYSSFVCRRQRSLRTARPGPNREYRFVEGLPMKALPESRSRMARRFPAWRLAGVAAALAVGAVARRDACGADQLPDLETIRAAAEFYSQNIKTLEGRYVRKVTRVPGMPLGMIARDHRAETIFRTDLAKRRIYLDERESYYLPGRDSAQLRFEIHVVNFSDGARTAHLMYSHVVSPAETEVPPDMPMWLNFSVRDDIGDRYLPWDFTGLRLIEMGSLSAVLRNPMTRVEGLEVVGGTQCVRVALTFENTRPVVAWLDPARDFLPMRIELWRAAGEPKRLHRLDVLQFERFSDAAGGADVWFPTKTRAQSWIDELTDMETFDLRINAPIDPAHLSMRIEDLPDGVQVNDWSPGGGTSYTGGRKDLWDERKRLFDEEDARLKVMLDEAPRSPPVNTSDSGVPVPAVAVPSVEAVHWSVWLLVCASIALIASGILILARRRMR
jgi:hypothetical protein